MEINTALFLLEWYQKNGIDIPLCDQPRNQLDMSGVSAPMMPSKPFFALPHEPQHHPALSCQTLDELKQALLQFEGCSLKDTAMNLVFADGYPQAKVMLVGEAPGADEDRQGRPFVGQSGQLLDKILKAIGLDRTAVYISNIIPWRPPGNRPPTTQEIAVCQPFIHRHIQLIEPKILILLGGVAAKTLLQRTDGIMRLRGQWHSYSLHDKVTAKVMATFHPAYLMRSPGQKSLVWHDFVMIEKVLKTL